MADKTIITKNGLKIGKWIPKTQSYEYEITKYPFQCIRDTVDIEPDVTLGDIFRMVEADEILTNFIACYSYCGWIGEFHEAAKEPLTKEDSGEVVALEISHVLEVHDYDGKFPTSIEYWQNFSGVGRDGGEHPFYSVSYTPVNELVHLPVMLNKKVKCMRNWTEKLLEGEKEFSLLEVLDCIYYDISFHGGPKDNATFIEELDEQIKDIDEGRAELIPFEDVLAELNAKSEERRAEIES